jgi:hypothetical protein
MKENRIFPRIESDWRMLLATDGHHKPTGCVKNISLSGALLSFSEKHELERKKNRFTLKLINRQLRHPELVISGLKQWEKREKYKVFLGLAIDKLEKEQRASLIQFLSRSNKFQVQVFVL